MKDIYQERYIKHQESKKTMKAIMPIRRYSDSEIAPLFDIMYNRRSQRLFNDKDIPEEDLVTLINAAGTSPSSCNRMAVGIKIVRNKAKIDALSSRFLVGGKGWLGKANLVLLFLADMYAYKSLAEVDFMPFLDTGFMAQNIYLACEATSIGACFVNPNIRDEDKEEFNSLFVPEGHRFCGAMALGLYGMRECKKAPNDVEIKGDWSGYE